MRWSLLILVMLVAWLAWSILRGDPLAPAPSTGSSYEGVHAGVGVEQRGGDDTHRVSVPVADGAPSTELIGSVIDESGRPVQGARVAIHAGSSASPIPREDAVSWTPPATVRVLGWGATDVRGRFRLSTEALHDEIVDIVASKPGWRRAGIQGFSPRPHQAPITLVLTRGLGISGRTITIGGEPVSGVKVFACSDPRTKATGFRTSTTTGWMVPAETGLSDGFAWSEGVSDDNGHFQLGGLARGDLFLNTLSDRWMATSMPTVSAGATGVTVTVVPALHIRCVMESAGDRALDSFTGTIHLGSSSVPDWGPPFSFTGNHGILEAWIGQESPSPVADRILLALRAPGHRAHRQQHPLEDGVADLRVRLEPEPSVLVPLVVVDRDGKRVVDIQVDHAAPRDASFHSAVVTDVQGAPHVRLPPGLWQLRVRGRSQFPMAVPVLTTVEVVPGHTASVLATLTGGPTLTIDLRNITGQEDIKVIEFRSKSGMLQLARVDAQPGLVVWHSMPAATWEVLVKPNGLPVMSKLIDVASDDVWLAFP